LKALAIVSVFIMVLLALISVKTAIPDEGGVRNLVGYKTCCPFAPASTAIGIAIVIALFFGARRWSLF